MDRISSIFARFEPSRSSIAMTSDVIGHVLPRASVGGGCVFHEERHRVRTPYSRPQQHQAYPPSTTKPLVIVSPISAEIASPASVELPQTPLGNQMEASLARRMNNATVRASYDHQEAREEPVRDLTTRSPPDQEEAHAPICPIDPALPTTPLSKPATRALPSVKTIQVADPAKPKPKRKRIRLKTARRREQCRTNQARYRKKQNELARGLETTVLLLRQEIPMLETQHTRLVSNAKLSAWYVVMEYFRVFRNGARLSDQTASGPEAWLQKAEAQQQLAFLQYSMSDYVVLGEQRGVSTLLEQWKRFTTSFDDLQFQVEDMTRVSNDLIAATASLNVTISESTLHRVFPHLLPREDNKTQQGKTAILRSKLLGQRLRLPCQLCFEWDEKSKRLVRVEKTVNFLAPLLQVMGTLADAAFVLESARIKQDGSLAEF